MVAAPPAAASGPPLGFGDPGNPFFPTLSPAPPLRLPPAAFTCSRSRRRESKPGPRRRVCDAGPQPFPAATTALSGAAQGWRARRPPGGDARPAPGGETLPLSVRPGKSSLTAASRERAGGRPNGEGSRRAGKGCHVAQVDRCSPPPPPPPASGRDLWFVLGLRWGAWARPALAAPVTPARRLPPLRLPSVSRSRPGPFCRIGPAFPRLERKPDVFPPSLVVGSHGGASPFQCVGFSRKAGVVVS